jgi:serine/threonine-protein kinase
MTELQQLRPGDFFAGRYRVVKLIRAGGMGAVYEAEDTATRRHRALKLMHPSLVQSPDSRMRFQREVFIGAELETEHVVEVLDAGLDQATQVPYLTMELLKGEELGDRLERTQRLAPEETVTIMTQVARALDKAHGKGIVHRDLKPENIYLTFREDGTVRAKILDFGIAKLVEEGVKTNATQAAGTPLYMAPEQTDKMGHVSPVTDVWALGLVTYRMLVGGSYWTGDSLQQLYRQILMDPITSPVERARAYGVQLPPAFDYWFSRCVTRNPNERFPSAGQAIAELSNVFGVSISKPVAFAPPPSPSNPGSGAYDQTAPPVANMTPGGTPHPATMYATPQGMPFGQTSYPNPQITPHPGPYTTPMPAPTPFGTPSPGHVMGTQVAGPDVMAAMGLHSSSTGAMVPASPTHTPQPKKGNGALIAGVVVGVLAVGGGLAFAVTSSGKKPEQPGTTSETSTPTKASASQKAPKEPSLAEIVEDLNPFLPVGDKGFQLHKHEVTREEFANYLAKSKSPKKPLDGVTPKVGGKEGKQPVVWVTYEAAEDYCQAIKARLPTAQEWDAAVAGPSKNKYPWGSTWPKGGFADLATDKGSGANVVDVGTSAKDRGPYGHLDLGGNVSEWTSTDVKGSYKALRGGNIDSDASQFDSPGEKFSEASAPPGAVNIVKAGPTLGFRCARDGS